MRVLILVLLLCFGYRSLILAQNDSKSAKRTLKKHFVKVEGQSSPFYMLEHEVSNAEYRKFLASLNKEERKKYAIDSTGWRVLEFGEAYERLYHRSEVFSNYPVVNIRREAALAYCRWFEQKINALAKGPVEYEVNLPSEKEWVFAAKAGNDKNIFPWEGLHLRDEKGRFKANFTYIPQAWIKRNGEDFEVLKIPSTATTAMRSDIIAPVNSYWPNPLGLYNMAGNVAEMLAEDGRTKGGSWKDTGYYMLIDAPDPYEGQSLSSPFIGFRIAVRPKPVGE